MWHIPGFIFLVPVFVVPASMMPGTVLLHVNQYSSSAGSINYQQEFTETYSFLGSGPAAASFPLQNNMEANWSDLSGLLYKGSLQFGSGITALALNFSRITLLPRQSLCMGSIIIS